MHPVRTLSLILAGVVLPFGVTVGSGDVPESGTLYDLSPGSSFEEGCFAPCDCPIRLIDGLEGTFILLPVGEEGGFQTFVVTELHWTMPMGEQKVTVTGSGTFRISGAGPVIQQMVLDLEVGGDPVERYDSGLVPATAKLPDIEVAISRSGFFCYDRVFSVQARVSGPAPVPRVSWGDLKSLYAEPVGAL